MLRYVGAYLTRKIVLRLVQEIITYLILSIEVIFTIFYHNETQTNIAYNNGLIPITLALSTYDELIRMLNMAITDLNKKEIYATYNMNIPEFNIDEPKFKVNTDRLHENFKLKYAEYLRRFPTVEI